MASQDIQVKIKTAIDTLDAAKGVGDLKKSLRELKGLALETGDSNSAAFQQITRAIGETNDKIGDLNAVIKSQSGEPIENLSNSFNGLGSSLRNLDFKSFRQQFDVFGNSVKKLGTDLFGGFNFIGSFNNSLTKGNTTMKALTTSTLDFTKALVATGIGVFVVAVGLLVAYYEDLVSLGGSLGKAAEFTNTAFTSLKDTLYAVASNLKLVGEKESEYSKNAILNSQRTTQAQKDYNEQLNNTLDFQLRLSRAQGKYSVAEEIEANNQRIRANLKTLTALNIEGAKYLSKLNENLTKADQDRYKALVDENEKSIKEVLDQNVKLAQDNIILSEQEKESNRKKNEEIRKENDKHNLELIKQKAITNNQQLLEDQKRFEEYSLLSQTYGKSIQQTDDDFEQISKENTGKTYQELLSLLEAKYKKEYQLAEQSQKDLSDLAKRKAEEDVIDLGRFKTVDQFLKETKISNAEFDRLFEEEAKKNELATYEEITAAVIKRYQIEVDLAKKARDDKFQLAQDFVAGFQNLNEIVGSIEMAGLKKGTEEYDKAARKKFNINKALQISSAIITGIKTTMDAFSNGMNSPIPLLGPATAAVYATFAALASGANIAKIASTQYQSSAGGGPGPSPGGGPPPAPLTPLSMAAPSTIGLGQMNIAPQKESSQFQRVYVVESDIRNTTNRVEVIENRSVLGS